MTLVIGATGLLGTEICRRLASAGKPFRAMVRSTSDPAKKETLRRLGGNLVEGDLKNRASLGRACAGAAAVITTPTAILSQQKGDTFESVDLRGQMQLIDAAGAAKVGHFVFVSVSGNLLKHGDNQLLAAKKAVENHLRQSGLTYTILRPTFFTEIWLSPHLGFDFANARATIYGSGETRSATSACITWPISPWRRYRTLRREMPSSSSAVRRHLPNSKLCAFSRKLRAAHSKNNLFPKKRCTPTKRQPRIPWNTHLLISHSRPLAGNGSTWARPSKNFQCIRA